MSSRADYLSKYLGGKPEKKKKSKSKKSEESVKSLPSTNIIITSRPLVSTTYKQNEAAKKSTVSDGLLDDSDEDAPIKVTSDSGVARQIKGFKRIDNGKLVAPLESSIAAANNRDSAEQTQEEANDQTSKETKKETNNQTNELTKLQSHPINQTTSNISETIYRDLSGRIIDLEAKRAEIRLLKKKKEEEELLKKEEINTGEVDRMLKTKDLEAVSKAKRFDVSIEDKEYVDFMSKRTTFEDPLLQFGNPKDEYLQQNVSVSGRPTYQKGVHPLNRFKIQAGYFWDGIDRSNGFEPKVIAKRNEASMKKLMDNKESYTEYDYE